jgi:hypothetical protein
MSSNTSKSLTVVEAKVGFSKSDLLRIQEYQDKTGPVPLPPQAAEKIFEAYLGGASLAEVCKFYNEYSQGIIVYTAYHYNWPAIRDEIALDLQGRVKQKVLYSKYQQLELVSTMIQVAHTETMQAMQLYLKNPNDKNLPKTMRIKTIKELGMAIEMMAQIIGQDNSKNISITGNITTSPSEETTKQAGTVDGVLTEATAKTLLKAMNQKNKPDVEVIEAEVAK